MSIRRFAGATALLGAVGSALAALTPGPSAALSALSDAQRFADARGADAVVLCAVGLLAWLAWAWGALGLLLTAGTALPGALGAVAHVVLRLLVPAAARRAVALALGVGVGLNVPLIAGTAMAAPAPPAATAPAPTARTPAATASVLPGPGAPDPVGKARVPPGSVTASPEAPSPAGLANPALTVPDWPDAGPARPIVAAAATAAEPGAPPDWPSAPAAAPSAGPAAAASAGAHVVAAGDCLWDIAATALRASSDRPPSEAEVADAARAWWSANRAVIGSDPDRLFPGQLLRPPAGR